MDTTILGSTFKIYVKIYPWQIRQRTVTKPTLAWLFNLMLAAIYPLVNKPFMMGLSNKE